MTRPHTIPVGGEEPVHECSLECWCKPLLIAEETDTQAIAETVVHHAKDLREVRERFDCNRPGEVWVIVLESYEPKE